MTEQPSRYSEGKILTWDDICRWKEAHPGENLYACARFDEKVHLVEHGNRAWVETYCGQLGPAKLHALVFKLPGQAVDCEKCKALARLQEVIMREKRVVRIAPNIIYATNSKQDCGTFRIEEYSRTGVAAPRQAVHSPFNSRVEAEQRAKEIAESAGYDLIIEHVFSPLFPDYEWLRLALQREPLDSKLIRILSDLSWYKAVPFIRADADAERASRAREMEGR